MRFAALGFTLAWVQGEFRGEFRSLQSPFPNAVTESEVGVGAQPSKRNWWLGAGLIITLCGCGGAVEPAKAARAPGEWRDTKIVHEPCDTDGENGSGEDLNGDGRSDLARVVSGGRELCRALDLNLDGRVDVWVYLAPDGKVRRRETDYDRDGRVDEIALFRGGQVAERHRATTLRGALDTWQYFEGGRVVKTLRDSDGDEMIDQWWEYPKADRPGCALVHSDVDHDGRPDPGSTVDMCADSALDPGVMFQEKLERLTPSQVPVQLDDQPQPGGGDAEPPPNEGEAGPEGADANGSAKP